MVNKIIFLFGLLLITTFGCFAQTIIQGRITDSLNHPIGGVNIIYENKGSIVIKGFTESTSNGHFLLNILSYLDSIAISFSHIGYISKTIIIKNCSSTQQHIILQLSNTLLKIITINAPPIYKVNDTLNYSVNAFTGKGDRTIGDVIKRIPGIEMQGDKILYNGKPLLKYYINGLDLLGSQYSLANKNLPVDAVRSVQIIENDQPIKVLDSLIFSDKASLNLQLKKFITTGSATAGIGVAPFLRDVNVTPMTFNKSFQMLNSFQTNNIGDDVSNELNSLTANDMYFYINNLELFTEKRFTGISSPPSLPFDEKRWLNNNIELLNSNILKKLKSGVQLRSNVSYYNDFQKNSFDNISTIYTPGQNIVVSQNINSTYNKNFLQGRLSLERNDRKIYLTDKLNFKGNWDNNTQDILQNQNTFVSQRSSDESFFIDNILGTSFFIKGHLISVGSNVFYEKSPQILSVNPGQFINILNDSVTYNQTRQHVLFQNFYADNNIAFVQTIHKIVLNTKAGLTISKQFLNSSISGNKFLGNYYAPARNDLSLTVLNGYLNLMAYFQNAEWKIEADIPLNIHEMHVDNFIVTNYSFRPETNIYTDPNASIIYSINGLWKATLSSSYNHSLGDIDQLYGCYILSNYNNIQKNMDEELNKSKVWRNSLSIRYSNPTKASFFNIYFEYQSTVNNSLNNNSVDSVGAVLLEALVVKNNVNTFDISTNYNKYLSPMRTIVKLNWSSSFSVFPVMFNNQIVHQQNTIYKGSLDLNNEAIENISLNLQTNLTFIEGSLSRQKLKTIQLHTSILNVNIMPFEHQMFTTSFEHYLTNTITNKNQFFLNLKYQYTIFKKRIDLELDCNNLLNAKSYITLYNSGYSIVSNQYWLRPRQFLFKVRFNFK